MKLRPLIAAAALALSAPAPASPCDQYIGFVYVAADMKEQGWGEYQAVQFVTDRTDGRPSRVSLVIIEQVYAGRSIARIVSDIADSTACNPEPEDPS